MEIVRGTKTRHTHTHTHTNTHTHRHTHTHTQTHTQTHTHTDTHTHTHTEAYFKSLVFLRKCRNKTRKPICGTETIIRTKKLFSLHSRKGYNFIKKKVDRIIWLWNDIAHEWVSYRTWLRVETLLKLSFVLTEVFYMLTHTSDIGFFRIILHSDCTSYIDRDKWHP